MADTSLIFSIIARDKTSKTLVQIRQEAMSTGKIVGFALGPALLPIAAVGTGAVLGLGAALGAAGVAAGVFGGVLATSVTQINENATKFQDLHDKIGLYGREAKIAAAAGNDNAKYLKKQAEAALELKSRMSLLPAEQRRATIGFMDMKSDWQDFVDANSPATFNTLTNGYRLAGQAISRLQPFFDIGRAAADRLLASLQNMVNGGGLEKLAAQAGPAMASLTSIIINVSRAVGGMMGHFVGQGQGILKWIEEMTRRWAEWSTSTTANTGINKFVDYVNANGGKVVGLLANLARAAMQIAQALGPIAPVSLAIASALAAVIAAMPPAVITTLATGYLAWSVALKAWAIYQGIATVAQWAMNTALFASPITWIVAAILVFIGIIVLLATKTRFFQTIWGGVWGFMKMIGAWFAGPFAGFFVSMWNKITASLGRARSQFMSVVNFVKNLFLGWLSLNQRVANGIISGFNRVVAFFRAAPGRIRGALSSMFNGLWSGFRSVVNRIVGGWNNLHFGIPGFSFAGMSFGGFDVGTPNLPYLARGTDMVRRSGLAVIHRGEEVRPARVAGYSGRNDRGGGGTLTIKSDGSRTSQFILEILRDAIRDRGGDPVKVLTPR